MNKGHTFQVFGCVGSWSLVPTFLFILTCMVETQVQTDECPVNCIDRTCNNPYGSPRRLACSYGCVDGFWGYRCANECPSMCTTCYRSFALRPECYGCRSGFFLSETGKNCSIQCSTELVSCSSPYNIHFYKECLPCPSNCVRCTSGMKCTECQPNFKGDTCEYCVDGYYGPSCSLPCLGQCQSCTSLLDCQVCKHGYYNSNSVTNCSLAGCPTNCETCNSGDDCPTCKATFYNTESLKDCSNVCPDGCVVCENANSCSLCKTNFTGSVCQNCVDGNYGDRCDHSCPVKCKVCSSISICTECHDGFNNTASVSDCSYTSPAICDDCSTGRPEEDEPPSNQTTAVYTVIGTAIGIATVVFLALIFRKKTARKRTVYCATEDVNRKYL